MATAGADRAITTNGNGRLKASFDMLIKGVIVLLLPALCCLSGIALGNRELSTLNRWRVEQLESNRVEISQLRADIQQLQRTLEVHIAETRRDVITK